MIDTKIPVSNYYPSYLYVSFTRPLVTAENFMIFILRAGVFFVTSLLFLDGQPLMIKIGLCWNVAHHVAPPGICPGLIQNHPDHVFDRAIVIFDKVWRTSTMFASLFWFLRNIALPITN